MARFSTDEKLRAALAGSRAIQRYAIPGKPGVYVGMRMLTDAELDGVRLRAAEVIKDKKVELLIDPEFLDRLIHRETLAAACFDPDEKELTAFFADQAEVAELDQLTVRALYELYVTHAQSMDPYAFCPADQVEELADTLGKSESSVGLLNLYDGPTLRSLCLSLALRLREMLPPRK